jgi:hypothetical protein
MVINNEGVTHAGNERDLEKMCSNLLELDLARNELNDLSEVISFRIGAIVTFAFLFRDVKKYQPC